MNKWSMLWYLPCSVASVTEILYSSGILNETYYQNVIDHSEQINRAINYDNDYRYDYFGFKTLERAYLLKVDKTIYECPQDMLMRVSLSLHRHDINKAIECYQMMSDHLFTHATPTLFNAGTKREQFSSIEAISKLLR